MATVLSTAWLLGLCVIGHLQYGAASKIVFTSSPRSVQPSLTKSLQLNCSLEDTTDPSVGGIVGRSVTNTSTNMAHVTSILVMRDGLDVASITTFTPAKPMSDLANLKVTGDVSGTSTTRGFLHLTWSYPSDQEIGEFTCTVDAVTNTGHSTVFSKTLEVVAMDTTVNDLIKQLHDVQLVVDEQKMRLQNNENKTNQLQSQLQNQDIQLKNQDILLKNQDNQLKNQDNQLKNQDILLKNQSIRIHDLEIAESNNPGHIEHGTINCGQSKTWPVVSSIKTKSVSQKFKSSYKKSPIVHLSVTRIEEYGGDKDSQTYVWTELTDVDERGFVMTCNVLNRQHFDLYDLWVSWISIGV